MSKWNFKALKVNQSGSTELVPLSDEQVLRVGAYERALEMATKSKVPNPKFSNFHVLESISIPSDMTESVLPAGNIEYGFCQALHGEEVAVAVLRSQWNGDVSAFKVLGLISQTIGNIPAPCGNCRDIMRDTWGEDLEIVSGVADGGDAIVSRMNDYLFTSFMQRDHRVLPDAVLSEIRYAIELCPEIEYDGYSPPNVHPERRYGALIVTEHTMYLGAHDVDVDYHTLYAIRDAGRDARKQHDPFVRHVIVVLEGDGPPDVMYKDRQYLLGLNLQAELLLDKEQDPTVYLATYAGESGEILRVLETTVKKWLPMPFSARNFGPEFMEHLREYYESKPRP